MVILIDTREQHPLSFKVGGAVEAIERKTLPVGDYAVRFRDGSSPPLTFERKSIGDLYGTMTQGYNRWKNSLKKARGAGCDVILIVEGTLSDILAGIPYSKFSGHSMISKLFTIMVRHKVQIVFCESRMEMSRYILETFQAIGREHMRQVQAEKH